MGSTSTVVLPVWGTPGEQTTVPFGASSYTQASPLLSLGIHFNDRMLAFQTALLSRPMSPSSRDEGQGLLHLFVLLPLVFSAATFPKVGSVLISFSLKRRQKENYHVPFLTLPDPLYLNHYFISPWYSNISRNAELNCPSLLSSHFLFIYSLIHIFCCIRNIFLLTHFNEYLKA